MRKERKGWEQKYQTCAGRPEQDKGDTFDGYTDGPAVRFTESDGGACGVPGVLGM